MFSRQHIIEEIQRLAKENGKPPGQQSFTSATGIREGHWRGVYWARWGDALAEAGCDANRMVTGYDEDVMLGALARATRTMGRVPTMSELTLMRRADPSIPSTDAFRRRWGTKAVWMSRLTAFCNDQRDEFGDVLVLLADQPVANESKPPRAAEVVTGYVYLLRSGRYYKIGRTNAAGRRERELAIQLPERAKQVHAIKTDDPVGIERYWHQRFADRRVRPDAEWFDLKAEDIAAFRRRTFQ